MFFKFAVQRASVQNAMNVNALTPTAPIVSAPSDLQQPPTHFQPSVNIIPVNAITQPLEVTPTDNSCDHANQQQITHDEIRPASLLNHNQVIPSSSSSS